MAESDTASITSCKQHTRSDSNSKVTDTLCSDTNANSTINKSENMLIDTLKQQLIEANLKIEHMTKELENAHKVIETLKLEIETLKGNRNVCQVAEPHRNLNSDNSSPSKTLRSLRKKRYTKSDQSENDSYNERIPALSLTVSIPDGVLSTPGIQKQVPIQRTPTRTLIADTIISTRESAAKPDYTPTETEVSPNFEVIVVEPKKERPDIVIEDSLEANNDDGTTECDNASSGEQFPCHICGTTFDNVSQVAKHLKTHIWTEPRVPEQLYTCNVCDEPFATTELLEDHKYKHEARFPCHMCDARLKSMVTLKKHIESHFVTSIPCEYCDKVLPSVWSLQQHMKFHTNQTLPCPICEKHFATRSKLDQHLVSHSTVKPYKCKFCIKAYSRESALKMHMKLHTGQKTFICDICAKGYYYSWELRKHRKNHDGKPKLFKCSDCDSAFHSNMQLKCHYEAIHSTETPYSCEACGVKFKSKKLWKYHTLKKHAKEKPYKCHICEKSFVEKYLIERHIKLHSGERPFPCQYCDKRFKSKSNLQVHNGYFHKDVSCTK